MNPILDLEFLLEEELELQEVIRQYVGDHCNDFEV